MAGVKIDRSMITELVGTPPLPYIGRDRGALGYGAPKPPARVPISDRLREALDKIERLQTGHLLAEQAAKAASVELGKAPDEEIDAISAALDAGKPLPKGSKTLEARDALEAAERHVAGAKKARDRAITDAWIVVREERPEMRRQIREAAVERMAAAVEAHRVYVEALRDLGADKAALAWASLGSNTNGVGLVGDSVPSGPDPLPVDVDELDDTPAPKVSSRPAGRARVRPAHIERAIRAGRLETA